MSGFVKLPNSGGSGGGVTSLNTQTGDLALLPGTGIMITPGSGTLTISATGGGTGTVTSVSVVSANGLAGTVANATTTPALTLSTTITGVLKGNGTAISAATAGTDYVIPSGSITGTASNITATSNSTLTTLSALSLPYSQVTGAPGGTVTSVALTTPGVLFTVSGSPVTTSGTLALTLISQTANTFFAAPNGASGTPTFRAIVAADVPTLNQNTTGTAANITATSNSTLTTLSSLSLPYSQVTGGPGGTVTSVAATVPSFLSISGSPITSSGTLAISLSGTALPVSSGGTGTSTAFTAGSVVFAGASGVYSQDNANFFWDATNHRLGVGTTTPTDMINIAGNGVQRISIDAAGTGASPVVNGRMSRGTYASPTATQLDDSLLSVSGKGYNGSAYTTTSAANVALNAAENWTPTATGGYIKFSTVPTGSTTLSERGRFAASGNLLLNTTTDDASHTLQVNGTILGTGATISGLTASSTVFTDASKNLTSSGTVAIANGGTGQTTAPNAINALLPSQTGNSGQFLTTNGTVASWAAVSGTGTVTSVALADSTGLFNITGSPVTTSGTLTLSTLQTKTANTVFAGPTSGSAAAPTFRSLVVADQAASPVMIYGNGSDGTVTISSGTTTLTRDMYYANLTMSGTGILKTSGFKIFVSGTLDISAAAATAIQNMGGNAGNGGNTGTAGTGGTCAVAGTVGGTSGSAINGAAGTTGAGNAGTGGSAGSASLVMGGGLGSSGAGGAGSGGAGGGNSGGGVNAVVNLCNRLTTDLIRGVTLYAGGYIGAGGGSGGGDGTNTGPGGGGAGGGSGVIFIAANIINRGASTPASCISVIGGNGGNGGTQTLGNCGGGGGGSGASGGWIYIIYSTLTGSTATNALDISGGAGGNGGTATGTGVAGGGGKSGGQGRATLVNANTNTVTETLGAQNTFNAASGVTGGAATTLKVSL